MALGVQRGENVGIWATNWPQWVVLQFATAHIGAVLVNVNPAYRAHELCYVLQQADISALFLTDRYKSSNYFDLLAEVCPDKACPRLRHVVSIQSAKRSGMLSWDEFLARAGEVSEADLDRRTAESGPHDVVNIQYTSGTTGFPKGAMLTHRNLLMNAFYGGQCQAFTECDRLAIPVPFYHCFGCVMGTLMCTIYGAAMVVPAESFDPLATLQAIQDERCTAVHGVPTMFIAELNHPRFAEFDLRSLRTGVMAGSPCPIEVMRAVGDKMGARELNIGYGLTEASPIITQTATTDDLEHRVATVGQLVPGVEVQHRRSGLAGAAAGGTAGRIDGARPRYHERVLQQAGRNRGGDHPGRLAAQRRPGDADAGRLLPHYRTHQGHDYPRRRKHLSAQIEEYLHTHPAILDVQVVGLPDERFGEEVCAWVRLRPGAALTEEQLKDYCRGRIAHYKVPRYVVFVDEYPTTVTGKVQKFRLRELGVERFGLRKAANVETA